MSVDNSRSINEIAEPKVIVSASGMCDAGRIRHHLKHNLWRKESTVLFVGYQAEGTLGRQLLDGAEKVKIMGEVIAVQAEICFLNGVSGHADKNGLINWLSAFSEKKPELVFVNHGEDSCCTAFASELQNEHGYTAFAPYSGTVWDLAENRAVRITEGIPAAKPSSESASARKAKAALGELIAAVKELLGIAQSSDGLANSELVKFTRQVRELVNRWKR